MTHYADPLDPEAVIAALTEVYPKTMSMTTMQPKLHARRPRIESALLVLVAQGRVKPCTINTVTTVYRLSESEAEAQGFKRENPVKSRTDRLDARPTYKPKAMNPSRHDATEAMAIMSRRGDVHVAHRGPIGIASHVRGGA